MYAQTTNVTGITGDGMAMALRAGVDLVDMEFVQYYPVVLRWPVTRARLTDPFSPWRAALQRPWRALHGQPAPGYRECYT